MIVYPVKPLLHLFIWGDKRFGDAYLRIINKSGWEHSHIIQAPLSSERFQANVVSAMQKKKILGVTSRYISIAKRAG